MNLIHKMALITIFSTLTSLVCSAVAFADTPDISGTYTCKNVNTNYSETIVFKKNGDVYNGKMININDMLPYMYMTVIFNPAISNAFGVVYFSTKGDTTSGGDEFFFIKPDGSLDGIYLDPNSTTTGEETCTKS